MKRNNYLLNNLNNENKEVFNQILIFYECLDLYQNTDIYKNLFLMLMSKEYYSYEKISEKLNLSIDTIKTLFIKLNKFSEKMLKRNLK